MVTIQFLTILLVVTCFLGGVVSVTDKEFKDLSDHVTHMTKILEDQFVMNRQLKCQHEDRLNHLHQELLQVKEENRLLSQQFLQLQKKDEVLMRENERQNFVIRQLLHNEHNGIEDSFVNVQNVRIEERVSVLEMQVDLIEEELTEITEYVTGLDLDVNFLFDDQVIQDERLLTLEQTSIDITADIENLQDTTLALDFLVSVLEENGGDDGNSSMEELEVRMEALEGTAADHETRISATESDVTEGNDCQSRDSTDNLQMTDTELDARVTALEESETITFTAALTSYPTIPYESVILFNEVLLNKGDGYDSTTGTFTVPSGGDGYYYFSAYFTVWYYEYGSFDIQVNGETICTALGETNTSTLNDRVHASCSAVAFVTEGDAVQVVYREGTDTTPLFVRTEYYVNGFNGFRI